MDHDIEIVIQNEVIDEASSTQLPTNFLTFGEIEPDDVKIYIKQDVYKALEKLSASDTNKELGSILIGDFCQELSKTNVIISQFVEAKYTDASASTLTFTHETWDYIHAEHERLYPDKKIIGWQHTHPNYGIFLSNYDLFIHENFFNLPFQIAYVIDPIQNIRGFFQWKNGKIEKLNGFYIYDDVGKPIKIEQTKVKKEMVVRTSKVTNGLILLLSIATCILSLFTVSMHRNYKQQQLLQDSIIKEIDNQNAVISRQDDTILKLQEQLIHGVLDDDKKATAADLIKMLKNNEITLPNQDEILHELQEFVSDESCSTIEFTLYYVSAGDTLSKICAKNNLDYEDNINVILAVNGIDNADQIYTGQTLLLPIVA